MIIEALLDFVYWILDIFLQLEIPQMPTQVEEYINTAIEYLQAGAGIINKFAPLEYMLTLVGIIVAIDIGIGIYHFIMWILKKIPVLGIE